MPRIPRIPKLCHHKATGRAFARLNGIDHYFGKWNTPGALEAYNRTIAEWLARGRQPAQVATVPPTERTVAEVLLAFWQHAQTHYRKPDGTPTSEVKEYKLTLRPVNELYGKTPAANFGPKALAAVRQTMIAAGLSRTLINKRIDRVKRAFKWAASEELVPVSVHESLRTLAGLRRGRSEAKEREPVQPVEGATVEATLPFLDAHLRAMVLVQRFTGMRPGEVCGLKFAEIDRTGAVWVYRPAQHKTAHHGRARVVMIGPKAQAALMAFLLRDGMPPDGFAHVELNNPDHRTARLVMADAYQEAGRERDAKLLRNTSRVVVSVGGCVVDPAEPIFSPAVAREERFCAMRKKRSSAVQPSQKTRKKKKPQRAPGRQWKPTGYAHAVQRCARRAGVEHWHPNQLRHLFATETRRTHGLEAVQVLLGHSRADVTQVYAERDFALAVKVASEIG